MFGGGGGGGGAAAAGCGKKGLIDHEKDAMINFI